MSALKNFNSVIWEELSKKNQIKQIKEKLNHFLGNEISYLKQYPNNDRKPNEEHSKSNSEETFEERIQNILKNIEQIETKLAKLK
ncbi:hypothetical protein [Legionella cincinnatiensis]|uniref:Uncharacterized protein n=1 Tax=Legionella cincinnatiensis TaxID=28085 RepID=A0A378INF9_9GAMM|nr:hypothetical protein [Legionella cincinnatiensis]KTC92351.1 hypothetical protein Lcin_1130 [Legionella cincinnatiensis]STX36768.1 Uncharacterised protein [Legionella cincinnatiensis]